MSDKTQKSGCIQCVPATWHKHKTREVTHNRPNREYHLLTNRTRQESVVHLRGSQTQFCYTRLCVVLSDIFFFNNIYELNVVLLLKSPNWCYWSPLLFTYSGCLYRKSNMVIYTYRCNGCTSLNLQEPLKRYVFQAIHNKLAFVRQVVF